MWNCECCSNTWTNVWEPEHFLTLWTFSSTREQNIFWNAKKFWIFPIYFKLVNNDYNTNSHWRHDHFFWNAYIFWNSESVIWKCKHVLKSWSFSDTRTFFDVLKKLESWKKEHFIRSQTKTLNHEHFLKFLNILFKWWMKFIDKNNFGTHLEVWFLGKFEHFFIFLNNIWKTEYIF